MPVWELNHRRYTIPNTLKVNDLWVDNPPLTIRLIWVKGEIHAEDHRGVIHPLGQKAVYDLLPYCVGGVITQPVQYVMGKKTTKLRVMGSHDHTRALQGEIIPLKAKVISTADLTMGDVYTQRGEVFMFCGPCHVVSPDSNALRGFSTTAQTIALSEDGRYTPVVRGTVTLVGKATGESITRLYGEWVQDGSTLYMRDYPQPKDMKIVTITDPDGDFYHDGTDLYLILEGERVTIRDFRPDIGGPLTGERVRAMVEIHNVRFPLSADKMIEEFLK